MINLLPDKELYYAFPNGTEWTRSNWTYFSHAEKGMTWNDWVNSCYNTDGFYTEASSIFAPDYVATIQGEYKTNQIIINQTYSMY